MGGADHGMIDHDRTRKAPAADERRQAARGALGAGGMAGYLLHLQRTAGNRAVGQLLRSHAAGVRQPRQHAVSRAGGILQRLPLAEVPPEIALQPEIVAGIVRASQQTAADRREHGGILVGRPGHDEPEYREKQGGQDDDERHFHPNMDDYHPEAGEGVFGVLHTHPNATAFSDTDVARMTITQGSIEIVAAGDTVYALLKTDEYLASVQGQLLTLAQQHEPAQAVEMIQQAHAQRWNERFNARSEHLINNDLAQGATIEERVADIERRSAYAATFQYAQDVHLAFYGGALDQHAITLERIWPQPDAAPEEGSEEIEEDAPPSPQQPTHGPAQQPTHGLAQTEDFIPLPPDSPPGSPTHTAPQLTQISTGSRPDHETTMDL